MNDIFHIIMCHSDLAALATLKRHLPYWERLGGPLLFFSPVDKAVRIDNHQALVYGRASHNGPSSIDRFRFLLKHMASRAGSFRRLVIWEYDALAISHRFPETRDDCVTANAFTNHERDKFSSRFYTHPPIVIPMTLMPKIVEAMAGVPNEAEGAFWDRWLPVVIERAGIEIVSFVEHLKTGYSQNTVEIEHLDSFYKAIVRGARVFHGIKTPNMLSMIVGVSPWCLHTSMSFGRCINYISFAVWGDSPKYWTGLERNLELAPKFFHSWWTRVYVPSDTDPDRLEKLTRQYVSVKFIPEGMDKMLSRFLIHDSPDCDRFIVRDADSRLSQREKDAVDAWITSGRMLHVCRDHKCHNVEMPGGLWGGMGGKLVPNMEAAIRSFLKNHAPTYGGHDVDQYFLKKVIYPACANSMLQHDAFYAKLFKGSLPFPTPRDASKFPRFLGAVFDENDVERESDWDIIKDAPETFQ